MRQRRSMSRLRDIRRLDIGRHFGASRGIGLEYVRQLAEHSENIVFALVRNRVKATELAAITASTRNIHIVEADVVNAASLKVAADEVANINGGSLDILIHNAALLKNETFFHSFADYENSEALDTDFIESFKVNVLGVIHTINAFLPLLRKGMTKKIIVLGAGGGDPDFVWKTRQSPLAAYETSKGACAVATAKYAALLEEEGFTVVSLSPGLVHTGEAPIRLLDAWSNYVTTMTRVNPGIQLMPQNVADSVGMQLKVIDIVKQSDAGGILSHRGVDALSGGKGGRDMDIRVYL
ncbi:hypothetical protein A0H81_13616 [Grifola frondosa]|uniref:Uncharacterized protein n=1 Tax=Grifola frondosa TaxID=5627 RepID=A0A1C7LR33_GRIFR|nr:hypothetical protein A0H81_13616 [Grifola frondosa]